MALSHQLAAGRPAADIEGLVQVGELHLSLPLSAVIGLKREIMQKGAGLRGRSLVGIRWRLVHGGQQGRLQRRAGSAAQES